MLRNNRGSDKISCIIFQISTVPRHWGHWHKLVIMITIHFSWQARTTAFLDSVTSEWDIRDWIPCEGKKLKNTEKKTQCSDFPLKNKCSDQSLMQFVKINAIEWMYDMSMLKRKIYLPRVCITYLIMEDFEGTITIKNSSVSLTNIATRNLPTVQSRVLIQSWSEIKIQI